MSASRLFAVTFIALLAFAGNSLLCRLALADGAIDAASFTLIRIVSGAATLSALVTVRRRTWSMGGNWGSAMALFIYAAAFSFAYVDLTTATGALLLFGAVQITMIGHGLWAGERLSHLQLVGLLMAVAGLVGLLIPGLQAPPLMAAILMLGAGSAWGVFSLRGRSADNPMEETAGHFVRAVPFSIALTVPFLGHAEIAPSGLVWAIASGAVTSGLGYAIWFVALPHLKPMTAATAQLSVPVLAAIGGVLLLAEPLSARLLLASLAIVGGVARFILTRPAAKTISTKARPRSGQEHLKR